MKYFVELADKEIEIEVIREGSGYNISTTNGLTPVDIYPIGNGFYSLILNGKHYDLFISKNGAEMLIDTGTGTYPAVVMNEREKMLTKYADAAGSKGKLTDLKAPMPGLIFKINVETGQEVDKGDPLLIIEAMKMENELKAVSKGKVKEVKVEQGQAVDKDTILITFD
ncbi:MAG: biotin/lipoyl-binding protein [candidate division Zixibacteria bacterium]|nr:biotin/lipoyl-binding protein [candidate division Zixibacteria bacterium]